MKIKKFILVYDDDTRDITQHHDIEDVQKLYLNNEFRSSTGVLKTCVEVLEENTHRLQMVLDDVKVIRAFIYENGLEEVFQKATKNADECWTHFNNIEIACDEQSEDSLTWKTFTK